MSEGQDKEEPRKIVDLGVSLILGGTTLPTLRGAQLTAVWEFTYVQLYQIMWFIWAMHDPRPALLWSVFRHLHACSKRVVQSQSSGAARVQLLDPLPVCLSMSLTTSTYFNVGEALLN